MIQLVIIGAFLYIIFSLLVKLPILKQYAPVLTVVNRVIIILCLIIIVIKYGLIRLIVTFISIVVINISELIGTIF
ncbi:hypothetical protein QUF56_09665 [Ureibacillus composti]|nr:hypothetical protein [Ureibacillus composti]